MSLFYSHMKSKYYSADFNSWILNPLIISLNFMIFQDLSERVLPANQKITAKLKTIIN